MEKLVVLTVFLVRLGKGSLVHPGLFGAERENRYQKQETNFIYNSSFEDKYIYDNIS
jgi:hypothetical protein